MSNEQPQPQPTIADVKSQVTAGIIQLVDTLSNSLLDIATKLQNRVMELEKENELLRVENEKLKPKVPKNRAERRKLVKQKKKIK